VIIDNNDRDQYQYVQYIYINVFLTFDFVDGREAGVESISSLFL